MNAFDDDGGEFLALVNDELQYSLWPAHLDVPTGWRAAFGPAGRADCLTHITGVWSDLRPLTARHAPASRRG